jgi:hypothetical protein
MAAAAVGTDEGFDVELKKLHYTPSRWSCAALSEELPGHSEAEGGSKWQVFDLGGGGGGCALGQRSWPFAFCNLH